eukprot:4659911-Karenia_brevis.AAC.1
MALILPMKLVNIGDVNLGGINSASWGTNVQMFATAGQVGTLTDWRNECKWVEGARCSMDVEPSDVYP